MMEYLLSPVQKTVLEAGRERQARAFGHRRGPARDVAAAQTLPYLPDGDDSGTEGMSRRTLLLVDDHAMVREGLRALLQAPGADCDLLEAGSCAQALAILADRGDVQWILLDLGLPDSRGIEALETLRRRHPEIPVVVVSGSEDRALVLECINAGAMGFVGKSAGGADLLQALEHVFAGGIYLPPALFAAAAPRPAKKKPAAGIGPALSRLGLSPRQSQVLELMVQGLSNKLIASRLGLSEATIKTHVAAGLRALNVRNRTQAVFTLASWGHLGADEAGRKVDG
jgi:DNA-binding NarL/FixJ family response regulator